MSTVIILLALVALFAGLARYARHDRFSAPGTPSGGHLDEVTAAQDVLR